LVASVAGHLQRTNKLISISPLKTRFNGEIGDIVIGRILLISQKQWKVDIKSRQNATLMLSAINLPGLVQRRKTEDDYLEMNNYFKPGDLVSAEVQNIKDGGCVLHTRSLRYGKLTGGTLVDVPCALVKKSKSHFCSIGGIDLILGLNGYIYVYKHVHKSVDQLYSDDNAELSDHDRNKISRICNIIRILASEKVMIEEAMIVYMLEASSDRNNYELFQHSTQLIDYAKEKINQ
jgi:exosome complex component RRP4